MLVKTIFVSATSPGFIWGFETWGRDAPYNNNMLQGYICAGFEWAYVTTATTISYNIIQGPSMSSGSVLPELRGQNGTYHRHRRKQHMA